MKQPQAREVTSFSSYKNTGLESSENNLTLRRPDPPIIKKKDGLTQQDQTLPKMREAAPMQLLTPTRGPGSYVCKSRRSHMDHTVQE